MDSSSLFRTACVAVALVGWHTVSFGQLYEQNFNTDSTAAWTVNDSMLTDVLVDFFYDYSLIGVPTAPNGTGTRGMKMTANNADGVFGGFSVSPTGENFTGSYRVSFDLWQNYAGPLGPGGSGSTQLSFFGIGTAGNVATWAGSNPIESVSFAVTLDGGSASDFRAYSSAFPTSYSAGNAVYESASLNGSDAYYAGFTGVSAPAEQVMLFAGQTGTTDAGEIAFQWRRVVIEVSGSQADWYIDDLLIASVPFDGLTLGGGNILFGHSDTNASASSDPNDTLLNVTLIDNIFVEQLAGSVAVPEPPVLTIRGAKLRKISKAKIRLRGVITGEVTQLRIGLRNSSGKRNRLFAQSAGGWKRNFRLAPGLNRIQFTAIGPGGESSSKTVRVRRL